MHAADDVCRLEKDGSIMKAIPIQCQDQGVSRANKEISKTINRVRRDLTVKAITLPVVWSHKVRYQQYTPL